MTRFSPARFALAAAIPLAALATAVAAQQAPPLGVENGRAPAAAQAAAAPPAPPPAPDAVARGDLLYQNCIACHGLQGRGGMAGAADLTNSSIAQATDNGQALKAFLAVGKPERGMPPFPVNDAQAADLSAKLRSLRPTPTRGGAGAAPAAAIPNPNNWKGIEALIGTPSAGKVYFNGPVGRCSTCHAVEPGKTSSAPNLWGVMDKYKDVRALQNNMVLPGRAAFTPIPPRQIDVTVTYKDGRKITGGYLSISDFEVIIQVNGERKTIERKGGEPKVVMNDKLQHHLNLLKVYNDSDIHNLTAYLATLR